MRVSSSPLVSPEVKDVVRVDVREQRRNRSSLWNALLERRPGPVLNDPCGQPFLDQPQDPAYLCRCGMSRRLMVSSVLVSRGVVGGAWARRGVCPRTPGLTLALDAGWSRAGYMMWWGVPAEGLRPLGLSRPFPAGRGRQQGFGNWPRFVVDRWACRVTGGVRT